MSGRKAHSANPFIRLILKGRIANLEDLRRSYRKIVMKTHPDAVGSGDRANELVTLSTCYEEAKEYLFNTTQAGTGDTADVKTNPRLEFYQKVKRIESLDMPYAFRRNAHQAEIHSLGTDAAELFDAWNPGKIDLYKIAEKQRQQIWSEKPSGPYMKHALALNIRPVLHNEIAFQLTGRQVYRRQARQNLKAIMSRLDEEGYSVFKDYLSLLIKDTENRPAVFD